MTPAEIAAAKMVVNLDPEEEGIGEVAKANRLRWRSDLAPALLSALEEARSEAERLTKRSDEMADALKWERAAFEARRVRLEAAEARADALQRERDEMEKSKWYERDRRKEAESRADALQAESDALHQKVDAEHKRANALQAEAMANHAKYQGALSTIPVVVAKETERLRARADAAWRAGVEAAALLVECVGGTGGAAYFAAKIRSLPPPSATAAPADDGHTDPTVACVHGVPICVTCAHEEYEAQTADDAPAEEEKCPECGVSLAPHPVKGTPRVHGDGCPGLAPSRGEVG